MVTLGGLGLHICDAYPTDDGVRYQTFPSLCSPAGAILQYNQTRKIQTITKKNSKHVYHKLS